MSWFIFRLALLAVPLATAVSPALAQQQAPAGWRMVYAVDSAGKPTFGQKQDLLAAVRAGLPIRVGWGITWRLSDGTAGGVEHVAEATFLTIHQDEVFAQIAPILGQAPDARSPAITLGIGGDRLWYALLDTTGRLQGQFTGAGEADSFRTGTTWYVQGVPGQGPARLY